MLLLTHILIALASMGLAATAFIFPSDIKIRISYLLTGLTLLSGTYLVISRDAALVQACMTGLIYVSLNYFALAAARGKLAIENNTK